MDDEILATVRASAPRRVIGAGMLGVLGLLLVWLALTEPPSGLWQVMLIGFAVVAIWLACAMWRATRHRVQLTPKGVRGSDGTIIAPIEQIKAVERGAFAFKPSNGFLIRLHARAEPVWQPGLWWRFGRRIGIGGMTPAAETKMMSDMIAILLSERKDG